MGWYGSLWSLKSSHIQKFEHVTPTILVGKIGKWGSEFGSAISMPNICMYVCYIHIHIHIDPNLSIFLQRFVWTCFVRMRHSVHKKGFIQGTERLVSEAVASHKRITHRKSSTTATSCDMFFWEPHKNLDSISGKLEGLHTHNDLMRYVHKYKMKHADCWIGASISLFFSFAEEATLLQTKACWKNLEAPASKTRMQSHPSSYCLTQLNRKRQKHHVFNVFQCAIVWLDVVSSYSEYSSLSSSLPQFGTGTISNLCGKFLGQTTFNETFHKLLWIENVPGCCSRRRTCWHGFLQNLLKQHPLPEFSSSIGIISWKYSNKFSQGLNSLYWGWSSNL